MEAESPAKQNAPAALFYTEGPRLLVPLNFSTLPWCESDMHSVETRFRALNFDLFLG